MDKKFIADCSSNRRPRTVLNIWKHFETVWKKTFEKIWKFSDVAGF